MPTILVSIINKALASCVEPKPINAEVQVSGIKLYHGTVRSRAKKILRDGYLEWRPSTNWSSDVPSVQGHVYLTRSISDAYELAGVIAEDLDEKKRRSELDARDPARFYKKYTENSPCIVVIDVPISAIPDEDTVEKELIGLSHNVKGSKNRKTLFSLARDEAAKLCKKVNCGCPPGEEATEKEIERYFGDRRSRSPISNIVARNIVNRIPDIIKRELVLRPSIKRLAVKGKVPVNEAFAFGSSIRMKGKFRKPTTYDMLVKHGQRLSKRQDSFDISASTGAKSRVVYHVTSSSAWNKIKKTGLIPRSGKRGIYADDPKSKRIYFFEDRNTAEDAVANWLGDYFPESAKLVLLRVRLDSSYKLKDDPELAGAYYGTTEVAPDRIDLEEANF